MGRWQVEDYPWTLRTRWLPLLAAAALSTTVLAACGGDDDDESPTQATTTATTPAVTSTAQPQTGSPADGYGVAVEPAAGMAGETLLVSPQYFIYVASEGDTVSQVADAFHATPDRPPAEFVEQIKTKISITGDDLEAGQRIAIRLFCPATLR